MSKLTPAGLLSTRSTETSSREQVFDMSKHVKFVSTFTETDKYFLHFKKVAQSLKWPEDVWTLLLQSGLVEKARAVYSALSVEESSRYETVKMSILKTYELVPETYGNNSEIQRKQINRPIQSSEEKRRCCLTDCV